MKETYNIIIGLKNRMPYVCDIKFRTMKNIAIILVCALAYCFGVIYLLTQYLQGLSQIYLILKFKYLISKATHSSIAYFCRMVSY